MAEMLYEDNALWRLCLIGVTLYGLDTIWE